MKYVGVIGYPLEHSLSPVFQQAALGAAGLEARYEVWETQPERLADVVASLRQRDRLGANVTVPHKEAVIPLIDELDEVAEQAGAVNTIVNREGWLVGYNTDVTGFLAALKQEGGFEVKGTRALVLGAGGAARAVVLALAGSGAAAVTVINRTFPRASRLVDDLRPLAVGTSLHVLPHIYASFAAALMGCRLLINCTPVGMTGSGTEKETPLPAEVIPPGALVFDLVYNPPETRLLAAARKRGARAVGGLSMLVYQGADSFRLWTGLEPPVDVMFRAAKAALKPAGAKGGG
ncbi:MAG: shikimate dehydrogenase [Chloroflexi bacterium]|nr:shikimate dehydrogenase [Chloroflexota bacterium]